MGEVRKKHGWLVLLVLGAGAVWAIVGCENTPIDLSTGPAPLRMPPPGGGDCESYEDALTGGHVFELYCASCHNARYLAERPFSNYKNVAAHMRVRANLTGKEYAKLMAWLRRWHDVPPPNPPQPPSPKRLIFSQPMPELQNQPGGAELGPIPRQLPPAPAPNPPAAPAKE